MNEDRFDLILAFAHAARQLSIGLAAQAIGVSAATVSRRITRLEDHLGTRLLVRTTRRIELTEAGSEYLARCDNVLAALDEADLAVADDSHASLRGRLRITAPGAFGRRYLAPLLEEFAARHPGLQLEVILSDELVDIAKHGIDVAIRMAALEDSSLVARRLADSRRRLYAAPSYLSARGEPKFPHDLTQHDGVMLSGYSDAAAWTFASESARSAGLPRAALRTNDAELLLHFALAGRGVAILPDFLACDAVARGALRILLPAFTLPPSAVYGIHISRRHVPARIRAFIDFIAERLNRSAAA